MNLSKRLMVAVFVTLACTGCDQGTKSLATEFLPKTHMTSYFYDTLRLGYTENTGAFLGLGNQLPDSIRFWIFTVFSSALLIGLLLYTLFAPISMPSSLGLSLAFGGGVSNMADRIFNDGAVIDFLNIGFGVFRTGIFNVADVALMLGTVMFLYFEFTDNDGSVEAR